MKKLVILTLIMLIPLMGCEWRMFEFSGAIKVNETFSINESGVMYSEGVITRSEVLDAFDIPDNADVKEVNIESMELKVTVLPENQAQVINVSGFVKDASEDHLIFEDFPVSLIGVDFPGLGLNSLIAGGVNRIKTKIEGFIKNTDSTPLNIYLSINSGESLVQVNLDLIINGNIIYEECLEVLPGMGGEECSGS